jgi:hypothetical protein
MPANRGSAASDDPRCFDPAHHRHLNIHQDKIEIFLDQVFDCGRPVFSGLHEVAPFFKDRGGKHPVGKGIIYDKNFQQLTPAFFKIMRFSGRNSCRKLKPAHHLEASDLKMPSGKAKILPNYNRLII